MNYILIEKVCIGGADQGVEIRRSAQFLVQIRRSAQCLVQIHRSGQYQPILVNFIPLFCRETLLNFLVEFSCRKY